MNIEFKNGSSIKTIKTKDFSIRSEPHDNYTEIITTEDIKHPLLTLLDKESKEIMRFDDNGDIYVHGNLIENDKQVVDGFREFLNSQGQ